MRLFRPFQILASVLLLAGATGCSLTQRIGEAYANDRAWVSPAQYARARNLFIATGSLDLVRQQLRDLEWTPGQINEAGYRLREEFRVLPAAGSTSGAQADTTGTQPPILPPLPADSSVE